jgi:hypothetical protein
MEWYDDDLLFDATPDLMVQYSTDHHSKVVDVKDPERRGRVRVFVPGLLGEGKENYSDWIEMGGSLVGGVGKSEGDQGIWWPAQFGQSVMMSFPSGDPFAYFAVPGPPCQKEEKEGTQLIPKEAKIAGKDDPRGATRVRLIKSEAGHTIFFDDRGKKEKLAVMDWTGAGLFFVSPGKDEDEKEKEGEESKERKGKRRGTKSAAIGNAEKPSKICRDDVHIMSMLGLMQAGHIQVATDDYGHAAFFVRTKDGKIGPSVFLDGKNMRIYLTAGEAQLQIRGDKGDIAVTRQIIKELPKKNPVEKAIEIFLQMQSKEFEEFKE